MKLLNSPYEQLRKAGATTNWNDVQNILKDQKVNSNKDIAIVNLPLQDSNLKNKKLIYTYIPCEKVTFSPPASVKYEFSTERLKTEIDALLEKTGDECILAFDVSVGSRAVKDTEDHHHYSHAMPIIFDKKGNILIFISSDQYQEDIDHIVTAIKQIMRSHNIIVSQVLTKSIPQNDLVICNFFTGRALWALDPNIPLPEQFEPIAAILANAISSNENKLILQNEFADALDKKSINDLTNQNREHSDQLSMNIEEKEQLKMALHQILANNDLLNNYAVESLDTGEVILIQKNPTREEANIYSDKIDLFLFTDSYEFLHPNGNNGYEYRLGYKIERLLTLEEVQENGLQVPLELANFIKPQPAELGISQHSMFNK